MDSSNVYAYISIIALIVCLPPAIIVSFLLGVIPVFIAWVYLEFLEYQKFSPPSKVHSDNNLVELGDEKGVKDDESALLEGGLTRSASAKLNSSSIKTNIIRFLTLDESFLRAMSEFGAILVYFYICDRTNILGDSKKMIDFASTTFISIPGF